MVQQNGLWIGSGPIGDLELEAGSITWHATACCSMQPSFEFLIFLPRKVDLAEIEPRAVKASHLTVACYWGPAMRINAHHHLLHGQ